MTSRNQNDNSEFTDPTSVGDQGDATRRRAGYNDQTESTGLTGSNTGGFDEYGGQQQRSGFGGEQTAGSDTASRGMGTGVSGGGGGRGPSSGAVRGDDDDFEDVGQRQSQQKPGMGQKIKGGIEEMVGKATRSSQKEAEGQERRTGGQY